MAAKNIRDVLRGPPHPSESLTLRHLAAPIEGEPETVPVENPLHVAGLPGDDISKHPLSATARNPFPGVGGQEISRRLREGEIKDSSLASQARAYLSLLERMGELKFYQADLHVPYEPELEAGHHPLFGASLGGLRRGDRYPRYESTEEHIEEVIQKNSPPRSRPAEVVPSEPQREITAQNEADVLESLWRTGP